MPVRFALPLPGPFYWVPHRTRTSNIRHTVAYWLFGMWAIEAAVYVSVVVVRVALWLTWWALRIIAAGLLWLVAVGWEFAADWRADRKARRTDKEK